VRYLGAEVEDALQIAEAQKSEGIRLQSFWRVLSGHDRPFD